MENSNALAYIVFNMVHTYIKEINVLCSENSQNKDFQQINQSFKVYDLAFREAIYQLFGYKYTTGVIGRRTINKIAKTIKEILIKQGDFEAFMADEERALAYSTVLLHTIVVRVKKEFEKNGE